MLGVELLLLLRMTMIMIMKLMIVAVVLETFFYEDSHRNGARRQGRMRQYVTATEM